MSSNDPAFYDHEADAAPVTPVPRPVVPPAAQPWPGEVVVPQPPSEPAAGEPLVAEHPAAEQPPAPVVTPPEPVVTPEPPAPAPAAQSATVAAHVEGDLQIPDGYRVVEGQPQGGRAVGIVVSRFNGGITSQLLQSALDELATRGIGPEAITIMPVPGAFELPIGAMALAKTRRFACVVALGCVIRGETSHYDYVAGEAASGIQLAALETGVPIAFGVLTTDDEAQAQARVSRGADAVRTGLELADTFARLRAAASAASA
jgi:6,7-dimethyl-8-ribityllumazine synthase